MRYFEIITEAANNYVEVFNEFLKVCKAYFTPEALANTTKDLTNGVNLYRKLLKKNDRIIWMLRFWRIEYLSEMTHKSGNLADANKGKEYADTLAKLYHKYIGELAKKAGVSDEVVASEIKNLKNLTRTLEHYLSLPIEGIQSTVFEYQMPSQILRKFEQDEKKWQDDLDHSVKDSGLKPFIDFNNGWGWYDLEKPYCPEEGDAMGHCGNSPRSGSDDTILSLRKKMMKGDQVLYKPYATFILRDDGQLTEMKGRFNEKPEDELHPMIIALLKDDRIDGITGGGYMPGNNFSLNDLPPKVRDALLEKKPELGGLDFWYKKEGLSRRVLRLMEQKLSDANIEPDELTLSDDKKDFTIQTWSDLERFFTAIGDKILTGLMGFYEEDYSLSTEELENLIFDVLSVLPTNALHYVASELGVRISENPSRNELKNCVYRLTKSHLRDTFEKAAGIFDKDMKEKIKERIIKYLNCGIYFSVYCVWADTAAAEKGNFDAPVELKISVDDMMSIVTSEDDGDDEHSHYPYEIRQYGWAGTGDDSYNQDERRQEEGLVVEGKGHRDYVDPFLEELKENDKGGDFDVYAVAKDFMRELGL